jgi:hypothetical protein
MQCTCDKGMIRMEDKIEWACSSHGSWIISIKLWECLRGKDQSEYLAVQDDDHVDVLRIRLWTAATNGHIVHPRGDILAWRSVAQWYRQRKLIRPPELSGKPTSSHLVGTYVELPKEMTNLALRSTCLYFEVFLTCRKILRHGSDGFTSSPKEAWFGLLSPLKIPHPLTGSNPRTLGPMASMLTIIPLSTTSRRR